MAQTITLSRFFTVFDYEEEEAWLRGQHSKGWKLVSVRLPCFYTFEQCEPEDVIYRLDFVDDRDAPAEIEQRREEGWSWFARCAGWLYFRKSAAEGEEREPYGGAALRAEMLRVVFRRRLAPILIIFSCCLLPNLLRYGSDPLSRVLAVAFALLVLVYIYLIVYCTVKYRRLRNKYGDQ